MSKTLLEQLAQELETLKMKKTASLENDSKKLEQMNSDFARFLQAGDFGRKKAAVAFDKPLKMKVAYEAILPKIFKQDNIANSVAWADVEFPEIGAVVVPFRGAPARIERGTARVFYKTYTVSAAWDVFYDDVFTAAYSTLDEAKNKVAIGLAIQLDTDLFKALNAAAAAGVYENLTAPTISLDVINEVRGEMMEFDLIATAMLLNPVDYYKLINVKPSEVDQVTLNVVIETGYIAQLYGVKFFVSKLCPKKTGFFITAPEYIGKCVFRQNEQIKISDIPWELKYTVVGYANYGLTLHNPRAVRKVEFAA